MSKQATILLGWLFFASSTFGNSGMWFGPFPSKQVCEAHRKSFQADNPHVMLSPCVEKPATGEE
jgi:hypothetical protein